MRQNPTGDRVAERISQIRRLRNLTLQDVRDELGRLGHPLLLSTLSKIENGQRRIDVGDLVAIALALQVTPLTLLLPDDDVDPDEQVQLVGDTESGRRRLAELRMWGQGQRVQSGQGKNVAGWPLGAVTDPFALEVHRAVSAEVHSARGLPSLPPYVPREHDVRLAEVVRAAAEGVSRMAVLVGGPSTGKTRACWEAVNRLRAREEPWRLWHPVAPTRPDAFLHDLARVGPYTVIWLNETQSYLLAPDGRGEQVAASLRELLRDPDRAPVLILGTLWPAHASFTTPPADGVDQHAHARELLQGHQIGVPERFTAADIAAVPSDDPRLAEAVANASDHRITQYLAGAPSLLERYSHLPPPARAVINAAIDARRLGHPPQLPLNLLANAAPAYLTDSEWDSLSDDWLETALTHLAQPVHGVSGLLTRIRPRTPTEAPPAYRLSDYIEQSGRSSRRDLSPPATFWETLVRHADTSGLSALADTAHARGLLRVSATLWRKAAELRDAHACRRLAEVLAEAAVLDEEAARWIVEHTPGDNAAEVASLLPTLRQAGVQEPVAALAASSVRSVRLDDTHSVGLLLRALRSVGADEEVATLVARNPAAHVALDSPETVANLLTSLRAAGAEAQTTALAMRAASTVALTDPYATYELLDALRQAGAEEQAVILLARDPATQVALDPPAAVADLLGTLQALGAHEQTAHLAGRIAKHVSIDDPTMTHVLLNLLNEAGAQEEASVLTARSQAHRGFRFGVEPNNEPSSAWSWGDLCS